MSAPPSSVPSDLQRQPGETQDERLFESPSAYQLQDYTRTDPWRVMRIMGEFVEGFEELSDITNAVAMFGSARLQSDSPWYQLASETARQFGKAGLTILTGAGPGIMEACNKGAQEVGALSVGLNIELADEQGVNPYVDRALNFHYFFVRKTMLVKYSRAFVFFPGGWGTLDELFEALTLIQTGKIKNFPVVLMGKDYWTDILRWIGDMLVKHGMLDWDAPKILHVTDDPEDAVQYVGKALRQT